MSHIDNVALFNQLTHNEDGLVDSNICTELLNQFVHYLLLRKITPKTLKAKNFCPCVCRQGEFLFAINFPTKKALNAFCEMDDHITYKDIPYYVNKQIDGLKVTVNFERR